MSWCGAAAVMVEGVETLLAAHCCCPNPVPCCCNFIVPRCRPDPVPCRPLQVQVDQMLKYREDANAGRPKEAKISVNDFVIKAAALALKKVGSRICVGMV